MSLEPGKGGPVRQAYVASQVVIDVKAIKQLVLPVSQGLAMLDLDSFGDPFTNQGGISAPVLSGDGEHVAWFYDGDHGSIHGQYGFAWRDLLTGATIDHPGVTTYGIDMSTDGRFVAYPEASIVAKNGYVEAMAVWLWDSQTGQLTAINRKTPNNKADDGDTESVSVAADGRFVVFASTSQSLAPVGESLCTPFVTPDCNETAGYVYLYDRLSGSLLAVPPQAMFGQQPALSDPVVSGNGEAVAFHDGLDTDVWYPQSGVVRRLDEDDFPCLTDARSLALSSDGSTLADNCAGSAGVVKLGGPTGPDTVEWTYTFPNPDGWNNSVALSDNGSTMALFGSSGPAGWGLWPIWRVELPSGEMSLLTAPGQIPGLHSEELQSGMAEDQVTISASGDQIAAVACSIQQAAGDSQSCPLREDVFRWTAPGA